MAFIGIEPLAPRQQLLAPDILLEQADEPRARARVRVDQRPGEKRLHRTHACLLWRSSACWTCSIARARYNLTILSLTPRRCPISAVARSS